MGPSEEVFGFAYRRDKQRSALIRGKREATVKREQRKTVFPKVCDPGIAGPLHAAHQGVSQTTFSGACPPMTPDMGTRVGRKEMAVDAASQIGGDCTCFQKDSWYSQGLEQHSITR